jgi:branched-chain amino acid transport system substrate-binding protein
MKRIILGALASLALCSHAALGADDTVTIGFPIALSGFVAPYDDGPHKAALLAIEDINAKGGLLGKRIVRSRRATTSWPSRPARRTQSLAFKASVRTPTRCRQRSMPRAR